LDEKREVYLAERTFVDINGERHLKRKMLTIFLTLMFASLALTMARAQEATVRVAPASLVVPDVGLTFSVNITVESVENLYGYQFKLYYSNDVLNGTSVSEGPFLKTGGVSTLFSVATFTDNYNATNGLADVFCLRTDSNAPGVNGSGTLATVTFKSTSTDGPKILHLDEVELSDPTPASIPFTAADGEVTVVPEFPVALPLPLFAVSTLLAIILRKRAVNRRR
jgi:hypothetical protein